MPAAAESLRTPTQHRPATDGAACAHHLFQARVAEYPHAPAVAHAGRTLTFAELDRMFSAAGFTRSELHPVPNTIQIVRPAPP